MAKVIVKQAFRVRDGEQQVHLRPLAALRSVPCMQQEQPQLVPDWAFGHPDFQAAIKNGWVVVEEFPMEAPGSGSERWEHHGWTEVGDGLNYPGDIYAGANPSSPRAEPKAGASDTDTSSQRTTTGDAKIIPLADGTFDAVKSGKVLGNFKTEDAARIIVNANNGVPNPA